MRTYRYRFIESSWGVAVDVTAHLQQRQQGTSSDNVAEFIDTTLEQEFRRWIDYGINAVLSAYPEVASHFERYVLVVDAIDFTPTDFQPEGVACAVAGWRVMSFSLPHPHLR